MSREPKPAKSGRKSEEPEALAVEVSRKPTAEVAEAEGIRVTEPPVKGWDDESTGKEPWCPMEGPFRANGFKLCAADGSAVALFFGGGPAVRKRRVEMAVEALNKYFK